MTLFRSHGRDACPISLWDLRSRTSAGNLVPHVTFGFAGSETWVSCGLVAILAWQGVSRASLRDQSSRKAGVRPLLMEPFLDHGLPERPWPTTTSMCPKAAWFRARNSAYRSVAASPPPPEYQPPRGARSQAEFDRYP